MLRRASATAIAAIIGDAEQDARRAIAELVRHRRCGPALLRLAFHDAATFDAASRTGGANASIRTKQELSHRGNEGLADVVEWLKPIAEAASPKLSLADVIQLAAVVVVEGAGGPTLGFEPGRRDSWAYAPEGRLFDPRKAAKEAVHGGGGSGASTSGAAAASAAPAVGGTSSSSSVRRSSSGGLASSSPAAAAASAAQAQALRAFASRLGMPLRHVVALAGVHRLGRWWPGDADGAGNSAGSAALPLVTAPPPGTEGSPRFDNSYFSELLAGSLPSDAFLLADAETRLLVEEYAASEATFFVDYAAAHDELSRLGMPRGSGHWHRQQQHQQGHHKKSSGNISSRSSSSSSSSSGRNQRDRGSSLASPQPSPARAATRQSAAPPPPPPFWASWPAIDNLATVLGVSPGTAAAASAAVGAVAVLGGAALVWSRRRRRPLLGFGRR